MIFSHECSCFETNALIIAENYSLWKATLINLFCAKSEASATFFCLCVSEVPATNHSVLTFHYFCKWYGIVIMTTFLWNSSEVRINKLDWLCNKCCQPFFGKNCGMTTETLWPVFENWCSTLSINFVSGCVILRYGE